MPDKKNSNVRSEVASKTLDAASSINKSADGLVKFSGDIASSITGGSNIAEKTPDFIEDAINIGKELNKKEMSHIKEETSAASKSPSTGQQAQNQPQNQNMTR